MSEALKSEYVELFKDGLSEGEGVGVGINFQQKIICDYIFLYTLVVIEKI
jgi:hypothetical protein